MTARQAPPSLPALPALPAPRRDVAAWRPSLAWGGLVSTMAAAARSPLVKDAVCVGILAAATLSFFWDAVAHGSVAYENDTRIFYFPLFVRLGEALKAGQLPLWSTQMFGGYPVFADGEAGSLYPLHLLALLLLPIRTAFLWLRPVRFFQAGVFTYLFCRSIRIGRFGSLMGALAFAFSGFAVAQIHHTNISTDAVWLPLALTFAELAVSRGGRTRYAFALLAGVVFGLQGLIVHVQVLLMSALALTLYCGFRAGAGPVGRAEGPYAWFKRAIGRRLPVSIQPLLDSLSRLCLAGGIVGIAGVTGAALSAVQLLPLYELGTFSFRGDGVDYAFATQYSLPPVQLLSLLLPDFFVVNGQYWGLWSRWEVFAYVGIAPLVLSVVAVLLARHRLVFFFAVLGLCALAVSFGEYSPYGIHRQLAGLPGFSVLRAPGRFVFLFTLGTAVLTAFGADGLQWAFRQRPRQEAIVGTISLARTALLSAFLLITQLAAMALPLVLIFAGTYAETHKDQAIAWLQASLVRMRGFDSRWTVEQLYQALLASLDVTQPSTLRQLGLLLATGALLTAWERMRALGRLWQGLLVVLLAVDLIGVGQRFHPAMPYEQLAAPSGLSTYLAQNSGLYRVFTEKGTRDEPDRMLTQPIEEANGYSSLEPDRHDQYAAKAQYAPNRLLDLLNVRFYAVKNRVDSFPSFNLTSFDPSHPLLSSTGRNPAGFASFRLNDVPAEYLRVVSTLRFSVGVPQGAPVARLTATDADGKQYVFQLLAGVHTAEWAWERPDLKGKVAHQLPPVARTWQQQEGSAPPYPAHYYYAEFPLGASVRLRQIDIQFVHPTAQAELYGLAAFDDQTKDLEQVNRSMLQQFRRVYADDDAILYENQDYLPRAFLVPSAVIQRSGDEILTRMAQGDFSPERLVILEDQFDLSKLAPPAPADTPIPPVQFNRPLGTDISSGPGTVDIVGREDDRVRMAVNARQNAMLLLADPAYPGWRAYVDGAETPIYRADFLFSAVYVPVGPHTVEFIYRPRSFRLGLLITLLGAAGVVVALVALAAGTAGGVLSGRRRRGAGRWQSGRHGVTMTFPGTALPVTEAVTADGAISRTEGAREDGRQEPKEHG